MLTNGTAELIFHHHHVDVEPNNNAWQIFDPALAIYKKGSKQRRNKISDKYFHQTVPTIRKRIKNIFSLFFNYWESQLALTNVEHLFNTSLSKIFLGKLINPKLKNCNTYHIIPGLWRKQFGCMLCPHTCLQVLNNKVERRATAQRARTRTLHYIK